MLEVDAASCNFSRAAWALPSEILLLYYLYESINIIFTTITCLQSESLRLQQFMFVLAALKLPVSLSVWSDLGSLEKKNLQQIILCFHQNLTSIG